MGKSINDKHFIIREFSYVVNITIRVKLDKTLLIALVFFVFEMPKILRLA